MQEVNVGIVGLGNVGSSTLAILAENAEQIERKLGYRLKVVAVCSRTVHAKTIPPALGSVVKTSDWRDVVTHPDVQIVAELVGGTSVAGEIVNAAIANRKSVVTANKELMAACGPEIWDRAIQAGINVAMEASVCGGIPIHAVLREGISGDRDTGPIRDSERNLQLHTDRDREARRVHGRDDRGGAAAGLRRSRPERRRGRLRRAEQAGITGGAGVRGKDHALGHLHGGDPADHARWISSTRGS